MNCISCRAPVDLSAKRCGACGVALDADGDGVPDVLAKMVEDKARALLASERAREAADAEAKAQEERAVAQRAQVAANRASLAQAQASLETNTEKPRRVFYIDKLVLTIIMLASLVLGAAILPGCVEPMAGRSVLAARLFCPDKCAGCRGPGRIFTWHESGGTYEGNVSSQICHNPEVDVDTMSWLDGHSDDPKFERHRLSLWWSVPLDFGLVLVLLLAFFPFYAAHFRAKSIARERALLESRIATLEAGLALAAPQMPDPSAYRS